MGIGSDMKRHSQDPERQTAYHTLGRQSKFPKLSYKVNSFASENSPPPCFSTKGGRGKKGKRKKKTSQILSDASKETKYRREKSGKN